MLPGYVNENRPQVQPVRAPVQTAAGARRPPVGQDGRRPWRRRGRPAAPDHHGRPWTLPRTPGAAVTAPAPAAERARQTKADVVVAVSGIVPVAIAERRFLGLLFQEPPRTTRRQGAGQASGAGSRVVRAPPAPEDRAARLPEQPLQLCRCRRRRSTQRAMPAAALRGPRSAVAPPGQPLAPTRQPSATPPPTRRPDTRRPRPPRRLPVPDRCTCPRPEQTVRDARVEPTRLQAQLYLTPRRPVESPDPPPPPARCSPRHAPRTQNPRPKRCTPTTPTVARTPPSRTTPPSPPPCWPRPDPPHTPPSSPSRTLAALSTAPRPPPRSPPPSLIGRPDAHRSPARPRAPARRPATRPLPCR